jgi:hypothetical protein
VCAAWLHESAPAGGITCWMPCDTVNLETVTHNHSFESLFSWSDVGRIFWNRFLCLRQPDSGAIWFYERAGLLVG